MRGGRAEGLGLTGCWRGQHSGTRGEDLRCLCSGDTVPSANHRAGGQLLPAPPSTPSHRTLFLWPLSLQRALLFPPELPLLSGNTHPAAHRGAERLRGSSLER